MFCTGCGKELFSDDDAYCRNCGTLKFALSTPTTGGNDPKSLAIEPDAKSVSLRIAQHIRQLNLSRETIASNLPSSRQITEEKILEQVDRHALTDSVARTMRANGFRTRITEEEKEIYIELSKGAAPKTGTIPSDTITVKIEPDAESTIISVGRAKWEEKALAQKVGAVVFLPLSFSRSSGLLRDKSLDSIWAAVDYYLKGSGSSSVEEIIMEGHGQAIEPRLFGGRNSELTFFCTRLQGAIDGRVRNIAVTGESGIGKSSLLRKFEEIARDKNCLTVRREFDPTITNLKDLANFILESYRSEAYIILSKRTEAWDKTKDFFRRRSFSVSGLGMGSVSIGSPSETAAQILQESVFKEGMRLWHQLSKSSVPAVVFLFDEAGEIQNVEGGWRFVKSLFTRFTEAGAKFMLCVAGDIDFSKSDAGSSPLERYIAPMNLKHLSKPELEEMLSRILNPLESELTPEAMDIIYGFSGGNPYLAQKLIVSVLAEPGQHDRIFSGEDVEIALAKDHENLGQVFSQRWKKLTREEKSTLYILCGFKEPVSIRQLSAKARSSYKPKIEETIDLLTKEELVVQRETDGKVKIFSEIFKEYVIEATNKESKGRLKENSIQNATAATATPR